MDQKFKVVGLSFFDGLTLVFIHLKLTQSITWSWWLVLLPVLVQIVGLGAIRFGIFCVKVLKKWSAIKPNPHTPTNT